MVPCAHLCAVAGPNKLTVVEATQRATSTFMNLQMQQAGESPEEAWAANKLIDGKHGNGLIIAMTHAKTRGAIVCATAVNPGGGDVWMKLDLGSRAYVYVPAAPTAPCQLPPGMHVRALPSVSLVPTFAMAPRDLFPPSHVALLVLEMCVCARARACVRVFCACVCAGGRAMVARCPNDEYALSRSRSSFSR